MLGTPFIICFEGFTWKSMQSSALNKFLSNRYLKTTAGFASKRSLLDRAEWRKFQIRRVHEESLLLKNLQTQSESKTQ